MRHSSLAAAAAALTVLGLAACNTVEDETAATGERASAAAEINNARDLNAPNSVEPGAAGTSPSGGSNHGPRTSGSNAAPGPSPTPEEDPGA